MQASQPQREGYEGFSLPPPQSAAPPTAGSPLPPSSSLEPLCARMHMLRQVDPSRVFTASEEALSSEGLCKPANPGVPYSLLTFTVQQRQASMNRPDSAETRGGGKPGQACTAWRQHSKQAGSALARLQYFTINVCVRPAEIDSTAEGRFQPGAAWSGCLTRCWRFEWHGMVTMY
jgi:hypothetical protein